MASITWIKLRTDMFDDEKIRLIERMPEGDTILVIWVKLLAYAGKVNCNGYIMITEDIPMNIEEMAVIFNRPFEKVRYAIQVLQKYRMVEVDENEQISITNWEKHQNIEGMEHVKKLNAERNKRYRERKKQEELQLNMPSENVTSCVTSRDGTDIDLDIDKEINNIPFKKIVEHLNEKAEKNFKHTAVNTKKVIKARFNEGFVYEDFKLVIDYCCKEWKGVTFNNGKLGDEYLQPSTLFNNKFDERLNKARLDILKGQTQQVESKSPNYVNGMSEKDLLNMGE
ncbi:MAG: phage replisome organizer N-terminal domain-containing protein [Solibacillus sp.]